MSLIELKNVNMVFSKTGKFIGKERRFHVLKNIDFSIDEGEIVTIVGESGCGKTTLGKIITGILKPTKGEVLYQDENVYSFFKNNEFRNAIQFIQQDSYAALNPVKTIYQSLAAPIKAMNPKFNRVEVLEQVIINLEKVGLQPASQFMYKYPHQLSGGQRQRILMARAISLGPKLIVADEPVSMIDVSLRLSILNLMASLNKELNIAFIYITHDLATARYIANKGRIVVMYLGEIVEMGNSHDLITNPKHPYTQALITAVPIPDPKIAKIKKEIPIKTINFMNIEHRKIGCSFYPRCLYSSNECLKGDIPFFKKDNQFVRCINIPEEFRGVGK